MPVPATLVQGPHAQPPCPRSASRLFGRRTLGALLLCAVTGAALHGVVPPPAHAGPDISVSGADARAVSRARALVQKLRQTRLKKVVWQDMTLKDAVAWLRVATGFNLLVNHAVLAKENIDDGALRFTVQLDDVSAETLFHVLLEPHGLAIRVHDNLIFITTKSDAQGKLLTRVYGISHITWQKIDFVAPEIHLNPSGFTSEEYVPEVVDERDTLASGEAVAEVLKEVVAPGEWNGEGWAVRATQHYLVIRAPAAVHAKIPRALDVIASLK